MDIEQLLQNWKIPDDVIKSFKENGIEIQQFKELNDELLKELCPAIGTRINLKKYIQEYLTAQTDTITNCSSVDEKDIPDPDIDLDNLSTKDLYVPQPLFPEFELKTLLTTSPCGKSILQYYDVHKGLTNKHRALLTEIIIRHIFTYIVNHRISYEQYNILTAKIIATFPKENASTYFVSPIKKRDSINGRPSYARGKLVDKVKNILYKSGERKRSLSAAKENECPTKKRKISEEAKEKNAEKITWLKLNNEPWDQVITYWVSTYELRKDVTYDTVEDFIKDWPILNDVRGEVLINLDFDKLYPARNTNLYVHWESFIEKVLKVRSPNIKDENISSLMSQLQENTEDNDEKIITQIKLLCYLIPPRGRLNKKKKFSTLECQEGIIVEVQNPGDVQAKIGEIAEKARKINQRVQPYLLHCDQEAAEKKTYLIIDKISNYEHILKFGKPKDMISLEDPTYKPCRLEVELRSKKSRSIPVHLTQQYCNDGFNPTLENIDEDDELITMESIVQELLRKLRVEHVVWVSDKTGNFLEVMFPLPTGDKCETMLHCLTQLGVGVRYKSIVSVLPCSVVHSALDNAQTDEDTLLRKTEDAKRWHSFVESIRSKLTVKQVVDGVRGGGELTFDYLTLIITADSLAALGLVENNASNIVAAMLVSPLMGPVMSITFGAIISDRTLVRNGFESLLMGMFVSLIFGFIFGLILGSTKMPWGYGDFPTEEMKSRGNVRSLWMGVLWALTSGTGVALALLQGAAGPLIGIAISASLLPPIVNCGLFWALACIWLLNPGIKIPHIKGESHFGNSSYEPLYHDYIPIEFAVNGIVSCCLFIVNVICIFITAILFLKIKEVAAPYTSTPDLRRFWEQDIRVAREANKANLQAEEDERTELMLEDLSAATNDEIKEKLEAAVQEALDDETYRKVKRMSYQSHNADEVINTIGLSRTPVSMRSSQLTSSTSTPRSSKIPHRTSNVEDIAALDKLLTSLLGTRDGRRNKSFSSHRGTPRNSHMPVIDEMLRNRRSDSWPERVFENSVVRSVINNIKAKKQSSPAEEPFLTPK